MANESEISMRFKVNDDGSVVLDRIGQKLTEVADNSKKMSSSLSLIKLDSIVNLGERAFHTAERIYNMGRAVAGAINDIERMSKVAGISSDQFQKMMYAAKMTDVESSDLAVAIKKLSSNMDDASRGTGQAAKWIEAMGLSVVDGQGKLKGLDVMLGEIADQFSTWEDGPRKIAVAVDLFGKSGERLIPFLNKGSAGLREFYTEAERLGIILNEEMLGKGSELEDKFKRAEEVAGSYWKKMIVWISEALGIVKEFKVEEESRFDRYVRMIEEGTHPTEGAAKIETEKQRSAAEEAGDYFLKLQDFYKRTAQPPKIVDKEQERKFLLEENLRLLNDQAAAYARMIELQDQLNRGTEDALEIANRMGISTKAAVTQWIEKDIVGEYATVLGSKLFDKGEIEQFQKQYTDALREAQKSSWGFNEFGRKTEGWYQMEEAIRRISEMKVDDTGLGKARKEFEDLTKYAAYLEKWTGAIKIDTDQLDAAHTKLEELQKKLTDLVSQSWTVKVEFTGYGSTERPIMEKIDEIQGGFYGIIQTMRNLGTASMDLSPLTQYQEGLKGKGSIGMIGYRMEIPGWSISVMDQIAKVADAFQQYGTVAGQTQQKYSLAEIDQRIAQLQAEIASYQRSNYDKYGPNYSYVQGYYSAVEAQRTTQARAQIAQLQQFRAEISAAGAYAQNQVAASAAASGGGGGDYESAGISININTINVGPGDEPVADRLDSALADLWYKNRSKLKVAIQGGV